MVEYDNTNRGVLWNNDKRETEDHPHKRGNGTLKCPHCKALFEMWIAGWIKDTVKGKCLSLAFTDKIPKKDNKTEAPQETKSLNEDIPF